MTIGFFLISLILGMRHGLDFDHLAIIDSMTRRLPAHHKLSRFVGMLFSFGHGIVVILFCVLINIFFKEFALPVWLDRTMLAFSIVLLILFGTFNIYSLCTRQRFAEANIFRMFSAKRLSRLASSPPSATVSKALKLKLPSIENPFNIMLIGAIFAISFDTISQVALFSLNVNHFLNWLFPIILGVIFMIGMMLTDGINGYIVSFLLKKSNQLSFSLSRVLTLCIGLFSTTIGIIEIISLVQGGT